MLASYIKKSHWVYLTIILFFSLLGMKALLHPGLFTAHDIWHQVARLYHYQAAINNGQFPPYWIGTLARGYGYPLFVFSYHFPWLLAIPILKIFDIPTTLKILFFLSYFFSGIFMYLFVNSVLKNKLAATISSILYLWLPYHFLTIFVSASLGIVFVFTFLPLLFLGIHMVKEEKVLAIPIVALGLSGIILSHAMHLIFLTPVIFIFIFWEVLSMQNKIIFIRKIILGLLLGIILSSFYLVPAYFYNHYTKVNQESGLVDLYKRNFINFKQLIYSKWGYGPIVNNAKDGEISFQLGIAQWISVLGIIILLISGSIHIKTHRLLSWCLLVSLGICIFLMLDLSSQIWQFTKRLVIIDYPFRELLPTSFIASICAGILIVNLKKKLQILVFIVLLLVTLYSNRNHINVNLYTDIPLSTYIDSEITTNSFNEYLPIWANSRLLGKPWNAVFEENLPPLNTKHSANILSFDINVIKTETISVGQFYFPGQTLYLDNKIQKFNIDKDGLIVLPISKGMHHIIVKYEETSLMKFSKFLSIIGVLILFFLSIRGINLKKKAYF